MITSVLVIADSVCLISTGNILRLVYTTSRATVFVVVMCSFKRSGLERLVLVLLLLGRCFQPVTAMNWIRTFVSDTCLIIGGLHEDTDYEFRVAAENRAGLGPYSEVSSPVKTCEHKGQSSISVIPGALHVTLLSTFRAIVPQLHHHFCILFKPLPRSCFVVCSTSRSENCHGRCWKGYEIIYTTFAKTTSRLTYATSRYCRYC